PTEPATGTATEPTGQDVTEGNAEIGTPADGAAGARAAGFHVQLDNFERPFDLLLGLIAKHTLDVTEVALSRVTDEFIASIPLLGSASGSRRPSWSSD